LVEQSQTSTLTFKRANHLLSEKKFRPTSTQIKRPTRNRGSLENKCLPGFNSQPFCPLLEHVRFLRFYVDAIEEAPRNSRVRSRLENPRIYSRKLSLRSCQVHTTSVVQEENFPLNHEAQSRKKITIFHCHLFNSQYLIAESFSDSYMLLQMFEYSICNLALDLYSIRSLFN
jgi:hypothetical protein